MRQSRSRPPEGAGSQWNAVRCREGGTARPRRELFPQAQRRRGSPRALGEGDDPRPRRAERRASPRRGRSPSIARAGTSPSSRSSRFAARASAASGLDIAVAGLRIAPGACTARSTSGGERIAFDLRFTMDAAPLVPFPSARMYEARLPSSKLVSPHPDSRFAGSYTASGTHRRGRRLARHARSQLGHEARRALRVEPLQPVGRSRRPRPRGRHRARQGRAGARAAALDRVRASSRRAVRLQRAAHAPPRARHDRATPLDVLREERARDGLRRALGGHRATSSGSRTRTRTARSPTASTRRSRAAASGSPSAAEPTSRR